MPLDIQEELIALSAKVAIQVKMMDELMKAKARLH